ncbi:MAG: methyltransferase [Bacteroidetes bacterium]|nr:methyltransferase [Bacteroidota bacterium]
MSDFWDQKFNEVKTMWGLQPSDSAIFVNDFFLQQNIKDILIPGVGYGRNAKLFLQNGIQVTGIEISEFAISLAKSELHLDFPIYQGSVNDMPFDRKKYEGIFCYALIHLLNKRERKNLIENCFNQLQDNGYIFFVAISKKTSLYGSGKQVSKDRFKMEKGLHVYYYDEESATKEFKNYGLIDVQEIDEPIKFMENQPPLKFIMIKCQKTAEK